MATLGFSEKIAENSKDFKSLEEMLGKSLRQPFTGSNAGANSCQRIQ